MKVKRLKMQSFRGIGDLTLEFDQTEPTVIIGINGVGKSSILECLAILISQLIGQVQGSPEPIRFFSNQDISIGHETTQNEIIVLLESEEFTWSLTGLKNDIYLELQPNLFELKQILSGLQNTSDYDLLLKLFGNLQMYIESKRSSKLVSDLSRSVEKFNNILKKSTEENISIVVYYPVNRAVIDMPLEISEENLFKQVDAYKHSLAGGRIDFKSFFEWFRNREDLENEKRRDNSNYRDKQLEATRQAISSLIPDFSNLRVERSPLRMTVRKKGEELIVNQLSDGEKCLLAMVGDLARRLAIANPSLPDPLQGYGVVLIDEIELHLHPKWQREIIPALKRTFPNCQFIVTTHSPQVISQVQPEGIYILEKTEEGIIAKKPESSFGRDSNRILEDLMDVPARPQKIKDDLLQLFRLIDAGDLEGARKLRQQLADEIGADEPEFVRADVLIRRKEILNK